MLQISVFSNVIGGIIDVHAITNHVHAAKLYAIQSKSMQGRRDLGFSEKMGV